MKIFQFLLMFSITAIVYSQKNTVAILDFTPIGYMDTSQCILINNRFQTLLVNSEKYVVLERRRMKDILSEQDFTMTDNCSQTECQLEIGQLLGVQKIIIGEIGKNADTYVMDFRLIDVETGVIESAVTKDLIINFDTLQGELQTIVDQITKQNKIQTETQNDQNEGDIYVSSDVPGSSIVIDGIETGKTTPSLIENLSAEEHYVLVNSKDKSGSLFVDVFTKKITNVHVPMKLITASLKIITHPVGAKITVDNKKIGLSPLILDITPGTHIITVAKTGYKIKTDTLVLTSPSQSQILKYDLSPLTKINFQIYPTDGGTVLFDKRPIIHDQPYYVEPGLHTYTLQGKTDQSITIQSDTTIYLFPKLRKNEWVATIETEPKNVHIFSASGQLTEYIGKTGAPIVLVGKKKRKFQLFKKGYKKQIIEVSPEKSSPKITLVKE